MAAHDVAGAVGRVAMDSPLNATIEAGGPERFRPDELIRRDLTARNDRRKVIADLQARYFGINVAENALVPGDEARLGEIRFEYWLSQAVQRAPNQDLQPA